MSGTGKWLYQVGEVRGNGSDVISECTEDRSEVAGGNGDGEGK